MPVDPSLVVAELAITTVKVVGTGEARCGICIQWICERNGAERHWFQSDRFTPV